MLSNYPVQVNKRSRLKCKIIITNENVKTVLTRNIYKKCPTFQSCPSMDAKHARTVERTDKANLYAPTSLYVFGA
jgi:hypothetical protein